MRREKTRLVNDPSTSTDANKQPGGGTLILSFSRGSTSLRAQRNGLLYATHVDVGKALRTERRTAAPDNKHRLCSPSHHDGAYGSRRSSPCPRLGTLDLVSLPSKSRPLRYVRNVVRFSSGRVYQLQPIQPLASVHRTACCT